MNTIVYLSLSILLFLHRAINNLLKKITGKYKQLISENKKLKVLLNEISLYSLNINTLVFYKKKEIELSPSFEEIIKLNRTRYKEGDRIEWQLNNKLKGKKFVGEYGIKIPVTFQKGVAFSEIKFRKNIIIKPVSGASARGVFAFFDEDFIWDVNKQKSISSLVDLEIHVIGLINNDIISDNWIVEECILNKQNKLAHDLKFYVFYGSVFQVVEVQRYNTTKYCYWSRDGEIIQTIPNQTKSFKGEGFKKEYLNIVENLSTHIPVPFLRIDFFDTGDELVFGEFTPSPGSSSKYPRKHDLLLGKEFMKAEYRLEKDLISGKSFDLAKRFMI